MTPPLVLQALRAYRPARTVNTDGQTPRCRDAAGSVVLNRPANCETRAVITPRRPLGTGPQPFAEPELSPNGDSRERGRTAAERAAAESPASGNEGQVVTRSPGRRRLGTGADPL